MKKILKPAIDSSYYTDVYKPNKNAMITGSFNNVGEHLANFDAFRNRATEIVDRLLSYRVSKLGGVEYLTDYEQSVFKKATAAYVEHWFLRGFNLADLDSSLNIGSLSVNQLVKSETFRSISPLNAIAILQSSSMWRGKVVGIDLEKAMEDYGLDLSDLLTLSDALAIFEAKGFSSNYLKEIDMTTELSGVAGITRWIKIAESSKHNISFKLTGGDDVLTKTEIDIQHDGTNVNLAEASVFTKRALADTDNPRFFYQLDKATGVISIYVSVNDDIELKQLLISEIYADDKGKYGLLGSRTNSTDLTEITRASIFGNTISITTKGNGTKYYNSNYATDWKTTIDTALNGEVNKAGDQIRITYLGKDYFGFFIDGTKNIEGMIVDNGTPKGLFTINYSGNIMLSNDFLPKELNDAEINAAPQGTFGFVLGATPADNKVVLKTSIGDLEILTGSDKVELNTKIDSNTAEINIIKSGAIAIPHLDTSTISSPDDILTGLATLVPSPKLDDIAYVGVSGDWKLYKYNGTIWADALQASQHTTSTPDPTKTDVDLGNVVGWTETEVEVKTGTTDKTIITDIKTEYITYTITTEQDGQQNENIRVKRSIKGEFDKTIISKALTKSETFDFMSAEDKGKLTYIGHSLPIPERGKDYNNTDKPEININEYLAYAGLTPGELFIQTQLPSTDSSTQGYEFKDNGELKYIKGTYAGTQNLHMTITYVKETITKETIKVPTFTKKTVLIKNTAAPASGGIT